MTDLREFKLRELSLYNGQDKPQIYIAYRGVVYDVTGNRHWRGGLHHEHWAGQDLTGELPDAPHGQEVFKELPVVGRVAGWVE